MDFREYHTVTKLWGQEIWLVNNDRYCAKILVIVPGFQCSMHYHPIKKETFFVLDGLVNLELGQLETIIQPNGLDFTVKEVKQMGEGESHTLEPKTPHRFSSALDVPSMILEISSTHSDDDVVRLEDSKAI